ncbi:hypothetical protein ERO13_A02G021901v2 [Gossypium hirsutum]|nr:hypothetical protein ERO13_A02G021901v2 [Gossypium hirsutum]
MFQSRVQKILFLPFATALLLLLLCLVLQVVSDAWGVVTKAEGHGGRHGGMESWRCGSRHGGDQRWC